MIICCIVSSAILLAQDVDRATEHMKNKEYAQAIDLYQQALDNGQTSSALHYNMGVAYAEQNNVGYALWHFLRAEKLGLSSADLEQNIQLVKEQRMDTVEEINPFFLSRWWKTWSGMLSSNIWAILSLIMVVLGIYGLYLWRTNAERQRRKQGFLGGIVLLAISILFGASAVSSANSFHNPNDGILLVESTGLRAGADDQSAILLTVHAGLEVQVQDRIGDWSKVRMKNGQIGWIPQDEIGLY